MTTNESDLGDIAENRDLGQNGPLVDSDGNLDAGELCETVLHRRESSAPTHEGYAGVNQTPSFVPDEEGAFDPDLVRLAFDTSLLDGLEASDSTYPGELVSSRYHTNENLNNCYGLASAQRLNHESGLIGAVENNSDDYVTASTDQEEHRQGSHPNSLTSAPVYDHPFLSSAERQMALATVEDGDLHPSDAGDTSSPASLPSVDGSGDSTNDDSASRRRFWRPRVPTAEQYRAGTTAPPRVRPPTPIPPRPSTPITSLAPAPLPTARDMLANAVYIAIPDILSGRAMTLTMNITLTTAGTLAGTFFAHSHEYTAQQTESVLRRVLDELLSINRGNGARPSMDERGALYRLTNEESEAAGMGVEEVETQGLWRGMWARRRQTFWRA